MNEPVHTPTPEEIAAACAEVQKSWSDEERELRGTPHFFPVTLRDLQKAGLRGGA